MESSMQKKMILEDEYIYETTLANGLKVYIHPKAKFVQTFCSLQVNFGGRDFRYFYGEEEFSLPKGTAHFAEHLLFENNVDALSDLFIRNNADINAYTSRRITSYYFSCQRNFSLLLDALLNNFIDYNFNSASIKKELKIIKQELSMNDDSSEIKAYKSLLRMMYKDESIYQDIGGSKLAISKINEQSLKQATSHFYHPENMFLLITGNVDPKEIITQLQTHPFVMKTWPQHQPLKHTIDISDKLTRKSKTYKKKIDNNIVEIGIKIPEGLINDNKINHYLLANPFFSMIFSPASKIYKVLKQKKLYNFSFSAAPVIEDDYGFFNISMETKKPKAFVKTIKKLLYEVPETKIDERIFKAYKRAEIGRAIKAFDDVKMAHVLIKRLLIDNINIDTFVEDSKRISLEDFLTYQKLFVKENIYLIEYLQST